MRTLGRCCRDCILQLDGAQVVKLYKKIDTLDRERRGGEAVQSVDGPVG